MVTVCFHGIYWIKTHPALPLPTQFRLVFTDVTHKKQKKIPLVFYKPGFEGGVPTLVECKVAGQSTPNYLLASRHLLPRSKFGARNACSLSFLLCKILYFYLACLLSPAKVMNWTLQNWQAMHLWALHNIYKVKAVPWKSRHLWPPRDKASWCPSLPFHSQGNLYRSTFFHLICPCPFICIHLSS